MEKYEQITVVGEGSYGIVMKCRHRDTDQIVAVKKFLETEEDATVRRMALREIRMLKRLRHENLITMIEVFRHRKRFYLVFEYLEGTVLDEIEKHPEGLGEERTRERIYQVARAIQYCHSNHIIHRDVKPENVLVSTRGIVKLCDFGFARLVGGSGEPYTEYVATRWYRAPELLVGDSNYGPPVDIWAIGCLFSEMLTGEPLFPGESDIDQLYLIVKLLGKPCTRHQQLMSKSSHFRALRRTSAIDGNHLPKVFPAWSFLSLEFLNSCVTMDPYHRPTAEELLKHSYFIHDRFPDKFLPALREKVRAELNENPLLRKYKLDILMSSENRKEEIKPRKMNHITDLPRWKINFIHGSVKRKCSSDLNSENGDTRSIISLNKNIQKVPPKLSQISKNYSVYNAKRDDRSDYQENVITNKYNSPSYIPLKNSQESRLSHLPHPKLEKALDLLSKLNTKNQFHRPKSTIKDIHQYNVLTPSPPDFQSLQSQSCRETMKSPNYSVLHPNITNINFMKATPFSNNAPTKSLFTQASLKKNDKFMDANTILITEPPQKFSPPDWFYTKKRDPWKQKSEDFTLPTVPGATASPGKAMKKHPNEYTSSKFHPPLNQKESRSVGTNDISMKYHLRNK